jgi:hypothetical protein
MYFLTPRFATTKAMMLTALLMLFASSLTTTAKAQAGCAVDTLQYSAGPQDSMFRFLPRSPSDSIPCLPKLYPVDDICNWFYIPDGYAAINLYGLPAGNHASLQIFQGCNLLAFEAIDTFDANGSYITANFQGNIFRVCADAGTFLFYRLIPTSQVPGLTPFLNIDTLCGPTSIAPPANRAARDPGPWIDLSGRRYDTHPPAGIILYDVGRRRKIVLLE